MNEDCLFSFLNILDIDNERIEDFLKIVNSSCSVTDFSKLLGYYSGTENEPTWWTANTTKNPKLIYLLTGINGYATYPDSRHYGYRPVFNINDIQKNDYIITNEDDVFMTILYGEYPQNKVDDTENLILEQTYLEQTLRHLKQPYLDNNQKIKVTGKYYTTDSFPIFIDNFISESILPEENHFYERKHVEYEYNNYKYIRFVGDYNVYCFILDKCYGNRYFKKDEPYWIKVEPITWLVDKKSKIAISKDILFSGMKYEDAWNLLYNNFVKEISKSKINTENLKIEFLEKYLNERNNEEINKLIEKVFKYFRKIGSFISPSDVEGRLIKDRNEKILRYKK